MELIITGDLRGDAGVQQDVVLWRHPFISWEHPHAMLAETWCRPQRWALVDMGRLRASGLTDPSPLEAGDTFFLTPAEDERAAVG